MFVMQCVVEGFSVILWLVLIDGNCCLKLVVFCVLVVKGDSQVLVIVVVLILVKVSCDWEMVELDWVYLGYGMVGYKGYLIVVYFEVFFCFGLMLIY